ncbi:unnamed protein product [Clavelina lepadiformis]|uniref:Uncharacterized protein n=1 Tax=Clavelina lepadiformis TaxID=159417 RepID=A0ABP0FRU6_CLALP
MDALLSLIRVSEEQKYVFEWRGEQFSSSHATKAMQHVCKAAVPKTHSHHGSQMHSHSGLLSSSTVGRDTIKIEGEKRRNVAEEGETSRSVLPETSAGPSQLSSEPHSEFLRRK